MEQFEPRISSQGDDDKERNIDAAVDAFSQNEGIPPDQREPLRRETRGLMIRLGSNPLTYKIVLAVGVLSIMATRGEFSPREAEAQAKPSVQQELQQNREQQQEAIDKMSKTMRDYLESVKQQKEREKNLREVIDPLEEEARKLEFEVSSRVQRVILFGLEGSDIPYFTRQREMLIKKLKQLEKTYDLFGFKKEDRVAFNHVVRTLASVEKLFAYERSNPGELAKVAELRKQVETIEALWRRGRVPPEEEKAMVQGARQALEEIKKRLEQVLKR